MANRYKTLSALFSAIADAIRGKSGGTDTIIADNFPEAIGNLQSGSNLQAGTATPTGDYFLLSPDEGYDGFSAVMVEGDYNLTPQNIAEGITIYGVEGTLKISASSDIPQEYTQYVDHAHLLYTGEYSNMAILEESRYFTVLFMMDDFTVMEYDESTTVAKLKGCVACVLRKSDEIWYTNDYRESTSTGSHLAKNIRYSSCNWEYNGTQIWPQGAAALQTKRVTPTGEELTVTADSGYTGLKSVTVEGEANLITENIAKGVRIYGVDGSLEYKPLEYKPFIDAEASDSIVFTCSPFTILTSVEVE